MEEKTDKLDKENSDPIFTGSRYVDIEILAYIDNLEVICGLNDYLNELCESDDLWKRKLELRYGEDILTFVKNNFKLKYEFLLIVSETCENKYILDVHLDIFKWLYYKDGSLLNQDEKDYAAGNGQIEVLKWLEKIGILPDQDTVTHAASGGHSNILEWLGRKGIFPDQIGANFAAANGHLNILGWIEWAKLRSFGYECDHDITEKDRILPDQVGVNCAAENGHLNILKWIYNKNRILPNQRGVNWAARNLRLNILEWVCEKNRILPIIYGTVFKSEKDKKKIIKWIDKKNHIGK